MPRQQILHHIKGMTVSQLFDNIPLLHCLNIFIDFDFIKK